MSTKIQIISDLHIDHCSLNEEFAENNLKSVANILVIAGDTCSYMHKIRKQFTKDILLKRFKTIIEVPGNHDCYFMSSDWKYSETAFKLTEDTAYDSKHYFLNNSFVDIGDLRFICSTLWSNVLINLREVFNAINDYQYIYGYTIDKNNERYLKSVEFIRNILENSKDKKCIFSYSSFAIARTYFS